MSVDTVTLSSGNRSVTLERPDVGKPRHLSDYLIGTCDSALEEAILAVEAGHCESATVTLACKVFLDKEEGVVVDVQIRDVTTVKGRYKPAAFGQMTLLEEG